jgi:hypothetical protein
MATRPTSISYLLNQIQQGEIVLPDLQRDFVWDTDQMRLFFDSVMQDYPFGSLLIWETQFHEVLYRTFVADYKPRMTFVTKVKQAGRRCKMVLDGQQRLQTLYIGAYGSFDGRRLYFNITSGVGDTDEDSDGPRGSYRFEFWKDADSSSRPKRLIRVADVIQWDRRHEEDDIESAVEEAGLVGEEATRAARNLRNLRRVFTSDLVPLETIDDNIVNAKQARTIDEILEIFVRVNTGGTRLSRSDLMFSLIKTKWTAARVNFDVLIGQVDPDGVIGIDKDFIIRGLLVNSDVPIAFDVSAISRHWDKMEPRFDKFAAALKSILDFCQDQDVRIVTASLLQPAASLYPLIYYVAKQKNCSVPDADRSRLKTFLYMLLFNRFLRSKSPEARLRWLREALNKAAGKDFPLLQTLEVIQQRQTTHWLTTDAAMLSSHQTLALNIVQPRVCRKTYSWQARQEVDHIFPQSIYFLRNPFLVHDIGNKAFLGKLRNIRKSDQPPWEYFKDVSDADLERDFLIERRLLADDKFEEFVSSRHERILVGVREFLGR